MAKDVNPPRGMRDFLPAEKAKRDRVLGAIRETYRSHGYQEIETPALEDLERLYKEGSAATKADPALMDAARAELAKLQSGDPANTALWKEIVDDKNQALALLCRTGSRSAKATASSGE